MLLFYILLIINGITVENLCKLCYNTLVRYMKLHKILCNKETTNCGGGKMFGNLIEYHRLQSIEEVKTISMIYRTESVKGYQIRNGNVIFSDGTGMGWITPFRLEIEQLLEEAGYKAKDMYTILPDGFFESNEYRWLEKMAKESIWNEVFKKCREISKNDGVDTTKVPKEEDFVNIVEVTYGEYVDSESNLRVKPMITEAIERITNVATFIIVDNQHLLICDEFGRTFYTKSRININEAVNKLQNSKFRRNVIPYKYVFEFDSTQKFF